MGFEVMGHAASPVAPLGLDALGWEEVGGLLGRCRGWEGLGSRRVGVQVGRRCSGVRL